MQYKTKIDLFIEKIPKAELHVHLEGTLEPELMLKIAERNKVELAYNSLEDIRAAYHFKDLRDFLTIYNEGTKVMRTAEDFYDVTKAYLLKCKEEEIRHTEIFIDFQTYSRRGISSELQMEGIGVAIKEAWKDNKISVELILCFLRHLGPKAAMESFDEVLKFKDKIVGVGLASTEIGYPPQLFTEVFDKARAAGFKAVAHAGEEGPWEYVKNSLDYLKVDRIDHGNKSCENEALTEWLIEKQIPLTLCPLSNIQLKNVYSLEEHTIKKMLDRNMMVTINSDDPAYFGGYLNQNIKAVVQTFDLSKEEVFKLAGNSIKASFSSEERKAELIKALHSYNEKPL